MKEASPARPSTDASNPWPGLESFSETDEAFFKGRRYETGEVVRMIRTERLSVVYGKSGMGKTSLLRAGVFPELRRNRFVPIHIRLKHQEQEPPLADQVKTRLSEEIAARNIDAPDPNPKETLWEYFHRKETEWWDSQNNLLTPVLVFDQFEEVLTVGRISQVCKDRADSFLNEFEDLLEHRIPDSVRERLEKRPVLASTYDMSKADFRVVVCLREDFLPELESVRARLKGIMLNRFRVQPLNGEQALDVVLEPAPGIVEEATAIEIVDRVSRSLHRHAEESVARVSLAARQVEPMFLSVLCNQLNRKRRDLGLETITIELVRQSQEAVLQEFYDHAMSGMPEPVHLFVEERLLTESGARNRYALGDAVKRDGLTEADITTLIANHIIRKEPSHEDVWLELTHDRLADVAMANRDARRERRELLESQAREQKMREQLKAARQRQHYIVAVSVLVILLVIAVAAGFLMKREDEAREEEVRATGKASETALATQLKQQQLQTKLDAEAARNQEIEREQAAVGKEQAAEKAQRALSKQMDSVTQQAAEARKTVEKITASLGRDSSDSESNASSSDDADAGPSNISVPASAIATALMASLNDPSGSKATAREQALLQAAQGMLDYKTGDLDHARTLLLSAEPALAAISGTTPGDPEATMKLVDLELALGGIAVEKLSPSSRDLGAIHDAHTILDKAAAAIDARLPASTSGTCKAYWKLKKADCDDCIGDLFKVQGADDRAHDSYNHAVESRNDLLSEPGPVSVDSIRLAIARSLNKEGNAYFTYSQTQTLDCYKKALGILDGLTASGHKSDVPSNDIKSLQAIIEGNIGLIQAQLKRWPEVQRAFATEVNILGPLYASNPGNLRWRTWLASALNNSAYYYLEEVPKSLRNQAAALPLAEEAVFLSDEKNPHYLATLKDAYKSSHLAGVDKKIEDNLNGRINALGGTKTAH